MLHCTCALRRHKVRKVLRKRQQRIVEHIPGHSAGLRQHMHRRLGIALGLIVKALALGIDLHAAFHHQRPRDQSALRNGP